MNPTRLLFVLAPFSVVSALALWRHGYWGIWAPPLSKLGCGAGAERFGDRARSSYGLALARRSSAGPQSLGVACPHVGRRLVWATAVFADQKPRNSIV